MDEKSASRTQRYEHILSDDVQDIIGRSPSWLLRTGSVISLMVILLIVAGSFFISYPDKVSAEVVITTTTPPLDIVAFTDGEIENIFFSNGQMVNRGDVVASMFNGTRYEHVSALKTLLDNWRNVEQLPDLSAINFGDISLPVSEYVERLKALQVFNRLDVLGREIKTLTEKIEWEKTIASQQADQFQLLTRELELATANFNRNATLHKEKVLADEEFEIKEREYLAVRKSKNASDQTLTQTRLTVAELQSKVAELRVKRNAELFRLEQEVANRANMLRSAITGWEEKYLLKANVSGVLNYKDNWSPGQYLVKGTLVFSIAPAMPSLIGKLKLPVTNSGKVKVGQRVLIKLDNFPYEQFGTLSGIVRTISLVPSDRFYLIDVEMSDGLKTSYNKELTVRPHLAGRADIITEDLSLFDRFVYQFRRIANRR